MLFESLIHRSYIKAQTCRPSGHQCTTLMYTNDWSWDIIYCTVQSSMSHLRWEKIPHFEELIEHMTRIGRASQIMHSGEESVLDKDGTPAQAVWIQDSDDKLYECRHMPNYCQIWRGRRHSYSALYPIFDPLRYYWSTSSCLLTIESTSYLSSQACSVKTQEAGRYIFGFLWQRDGINGARQRSHLNCILLLVVKCQWDTRLCRNDVPHIQSSLYLCLLCCHHSDSFIKSSCKSCRYKARHKYD